MIFFYTFTKMFLSRASESLWEGRHLVLQLAYHLRHQYAIIRLPGFNPPLYYQATGVSPGSRWLNRLGPATHVRVPN